ncbi:MAG: hypothetical protein WCV72_03070 [Patescibacteria group bacterium]
MQNKIQIFASIDCALHEARLIGFGFNPTERFDKQQVPATGKEIGKTNSQEKSLAEKLQDLKNLERQKRTKESKDAIKVLKEAIEKAQNIKLTDGQIEEMVNGLIEKHDQEVGTAVQIEKERFMLVHASETAVKLVLAHNKIKAENVSPDQLERIFNAAGFQVEANLYEKDQIPTARPFSEVIKDGFTFEASPKKVAPAKAAIQESEIHDVAPKNPSGSSIETLLNGGAAEYQRDLDAVYGAESNEPVNFVPGKFRVKEALKVLNDNGKRTGLVAAGKEIEIVQTETGKFEKSGKSRVWGQLRQGGWVAMSYVDGVRSNVLDLSANPGAKKKGAPAEVAALFNLKEADLGDKAKMQKLRLGSSQQFEQEVANSNLSPAKKAELIETFKVLDVSYGRVAKGNSPEREIALNKQVDGLTGGKKVEELFADSVGLGMKWNVLYSNSSAEKLSAKPNEHKQEVEDILRGGEVFMLRVDQKTHGGKLEARIDQSKGDTWANNIDAPQTLRPQETYIYKYLEISDKSQKADILKKYLGQDFNPNEVANYKIAQVEIPNCENPAIVIKKLEAPRPVAAPIPEAQKPEKSKAVSINAVQYFKNVPDGWTLIPRILDWTKPSSEFNNLPDPAIVDLRGKTLRESEYLNARKRLDTKPHKFIAENVDDVLGQSRESLAKYVEKNLDEKALPKMAASLKQEMEAAGDGKTIQSFVKRLEAKQKWETWWKDKGADERMFKAAELLYDWDCQDIADLEKKMKKEEDGFYLAKLLQNDSGKLKTINVADFGNSKLEKILEKYHVSTESVTAKTAIERALYDEDKINAARPPQFAGDAVVVPPTFGSDHKSKLAIWENQASFGKEVINVHSPLSLTIEAASLLTGYLTYIRTGTGRADALGEYSKVRAEWLEGKKASPEAKAKFEAIFKNQQSFDNFRNFVLKGQMPETGANKVSLPLNEIQVLIPGWKMIADFFGGEEGCVTSGKNEFVDDHTTPPPPDVIVLD